MSYKRFLNKIEDKSIPPEQGFQKTDTQNGQSSTSAVPEFTQTHTDEDAMLADMQFGIQPADIDSRQSSQNKGADTNTQHDGENFDTDAKDHEPSPSATTSCNAQQSSAPGGLSCVERKRLVLLTRPSKLMIAIQAWVTDTLDKLDPFRDDDTCWFHPDAQPTTKAKSGSVRPRGKIEKRFTWKDTRGQHYVTLNFGLAAKIVDRKLSKEQKDGWVRRGWHLSHLCGNWTCVNPRHATVEPGAVNLARNNCFSHRSGCGHEPPCMKEKKVALGLDGRILDASVRKLGVREEYEFDYTTQDFGDDEDMDMLGGDDMDVVEAEEPLFDDDYSVDQSPRDRQFTASLSPRSKKIGGLGILEAAERNPREVETGEDGNGVAHSAGVAEEERAQDSASLTDPSAMDSIQETQDTEQLPDALLSSVTEEHQDSHHLSNPAPHSREASREPSLPSAPAHSALPPPVHELLSTPDTLQILGAQKEEEDMRPSFHDPQVSLHTSTSSDITPQTPEPRAAEQTPDDAMGEEMPAHLDPGELAAIAEFQQHLPSPPLDSPISGEDAEEDEGWSF